jgi:hypothetical protein
MRNLILILLLSNNIIYAQIGGNGTYSFLNLPSSAHISALGGNNISVISNEPSFVFQNPATLTDSVKNNFYLSNTKLFADIYYGSTGYFFTNKILGTTFIALSYFNYGTFDKFDELGTNIGNFYAADYVLNIGFSKPFKKDSLLAYGFTIKPVYSHYDKYTSFGIVFDAGLRYHNPIHLWTFGIVLKNLGLQIKSYSKNNHEPILLDLQMGLSKKLKYAPFRLHLTFKNLNNWNLSNFDYLQNNSLGLYADTSKKYTRFERWSDEFLRHTTIGSDIILSKSFYIALGYNFQIRKELSIPTKISTVGLSWGFGLKLYRFQLHFARATYHLSGATNTLSISSKISDWYKK